MISQQEKIEVTQPLTLEDRRLFLKLSLKERRRVLTEQAAQMAQYYELKSAREERQEWQGGDIVEYQPATTETWRNLACQLRPHCWSRE